MFYGSWDILKFKNTIQILKYNLKVTHLSKGINI